MAVYPPINWQNAPSTATPVSATNLNVMEDRIEQLDLFYQMFGGTDATYSAAIGAVNTWLRSNGTSPQWRTAAQLKADLDLEIGVDLQAQNDALSAIAGLTGVADRGVYYTSATTAALFTLTAFARTLMDDADAASMRTTLGLLSMALQAANAVAITGGTIAGVTTLDAGTITSSGNLTVGGQGFSPMVTLADGATITPNGNDGNSFMVTVAGNRTMAAVTNQQSGSVYNILIKKSGSGRTITWNAAYKFPGGIDAQLSSGSNPDLFSFLSDGTSLHPAGKNLS